MSEKMLVTQALDELDLLVKKIGDKISKMKLVDVKKTERGKDGGQPSDAGGVWQYRIGGVSVHYGFD